MPADSALKEKIKRILQNDFPSETVDVSDGYSDNIHVIVVSRRSME
jgi:acid stress-induced BolA-like protein IbaG/YrbA